MALEGTLRLASPQRRYPARHEVREGVLVRDGTEIPVVVKRTRTTWRQRLTRTKGERSFAVARELLARGVPTPEPLGFEVRREESVYVARRLEGAAQIREWTLHRDGVGPAPSRDVPFEAVVRGLARLARGLHDRGVFFRDLSDGNVLLGASGPEGGFGLWLVDLNRVRLKAGPVGRWTRFRDLSRPGVNRLEDHKLLLQSYFEPQSVPFGALFWVRLMRRRRVFWDRLKRAMRPWRRPRGDLISSAR